MSNPHVDTSPRAGLLPALALFVVAAGGLVTRDVAAGPSHPVLERVVTMQVEAGVDFDEHGLVTASSVDTKVVPEIDLALRRMMANWQFLPMVVDGTARKAHSRVRMVLAATKAGEGYTVRLDSVTFPRPDGSDTTSSFRTRKASYTLLKPDPPMYPQDMQMSGISGVVMVAISIGPDGKVVAAAPVQSLVMDVRGKDMAIASAIRDFEHAALASARRIRVKVTPVHPGETAPAQTANIAYQFLMRGVAMPEPGQWRTVVRTQKHAIAWDKPAAPGVEDNRPGVLDLGADALVAENEDVHLRNRAVGIPLL